jgi:hypothetical protein
MLLAPGSTTKFSRGTAVSLFHCCWLISDRLKSVFEAIDPSAFAFQACDVMLHDGPPGPIHWLCDVVRVFDAFGEETRQGIRRYQERTGNKYRGFAGDRSLIFDEAVIGTSHIFRTPYSWADVFCDQDLKEVCKVAGLKGVAFHDCFGSPRKMATQTVPAESISD